MRRSASNIGRNGIIALAFLLGVVAQAGAAGSPGLPPQGPQGMVCEDGTVIFTGTCPIDPSTLPWWFETNFSALDVAVGANGSVWFIGKDGTSIYRVTSSGPQQVSGGASRIAVDPNGNAWVVNASLQIWRWAGSSWQLMPGSAQDIGIGANGTVLIAAPDQRLYRWDAKSNNWVNMPGGGTRVSVDPNGNPWVVNAAGEILQYTGGAWTRLPGVGRDIGVGADGTVYLVGSDGALGGYQVYRWIPAKKAWAVEKGGGGVAVGAGPALTAFVARGSAPALKRSPNAPH